MTSVTVLSAQHPIVKYHFNLTRNSNTMVVYRMLMYECIVLLYTELSSIDKDSLLFEL